MKNIMEKIKENKKVVIGIAVIIVLVIVVIIVALCTRKSDEKAITPVSSEKVTGMGKAEYKTENKKDDKKDNKKDSKKEETTKSKKQKKKEEAAWDGVEIKEEETKGKDGKVTLYKRNKKGEIVTNKKGEKVTRKASYPGEDEGWSPIVSPDDLKK